MHRSAYRCLVVASLALGFGFLSWGTSAWAQQQDDYQMAGWSSAL